MDIKKTCFELASAVGVSGDEAAAAEKACELLNEYMPAHIDAMGSVIGELDGDGSHIFLDAHIDQIGLIVRGIDNDGFVLFDRCGYTDVRILTGCEVTVHGKEPLFGVVCSVPPHLASDEKNDTVDIKKLAIDIGFAKECAEQLVSPGDRITLRSRQCELQGSLICSGAFDDRSCVAVILRCLEKLKQSNIRRRLTVMFSAGEETTGRGAVTGSFTAVPDEAIVVDVGFGAQPGVEREDSIALGKGASIGISPTLDTGMQRSLVSIAKKYDIPYQHDIMPSRTGTNCDGISVSGRGVKCALLSLPLRNMHTGTEVIDVSDVEQTAELLYRYITEGSGLDD